MSAWQAHVHVCYVQRAGIPLRCGSLGASRLFSGTAPPRPPVPGTCLSLPPRSVITRPGSWGLKSGPRSHQHHHPGSLPCTLTLLPKSHSVARLVWNPQSAPCLLSPQGAVPGSCTTLAGVYISLLYRHPGVPSPPWRLCPPASSSVFLVPGQTGRDPVSPTPSTRAHCSAQVSH